MAWACTLPAPCRPVPPPPGRLGDALPAGGRGSGVSQVGPRCLAFVPHGAAFGEHRRRKGECRGSLFSDDGDVTPCGYRVGSATIDPSEGSLRTGLGRV